MDSPAFAVTGMFTAAKVGTSSFTNSKMPVSARRSSTASVRMAVDPFQKQYQSVGKINVDYSRPKKLATYKRTGVSVTLDFPNQASMAGHYSVSSCGKPSGAAKIMMKYDEYCAKGMMQFYKRSAVPYGYYTPKCTEATVPHGPAFDLRVWNRTMAFRQSQKPINIRLKEQYETRRACMILANNCSREEAQFKNMPMSAATFMYGRSEALGTCYRNVTPSSLAEDYMAACVRAQLTQLANPSGVFAVGICEDGQAKGDVDDRRVIVTGSEFRINQQGPFALSAQQYESARNALKLYAHCCHHEEGQIYEWPAVAAAMCRQ